MKWSEKELLYLARKTVSYGLSDVDGARECLDDLTGGELDCIQLDILLDRVMARWGHGENNLRPLLAVHPRSKQA